MPSRAPRPRLRVLRRRRSGARTSTAVLQFALSGLAAVVLLGFVSVAVLRHIGQSEAIRDAKEITRLAGDAIVAPAITPGVLQGRPAALRRLDRIVRSDILHPPVVRVKLWDASGRILYSDQPALIGARYDLEPPEAAALRHGGVDADVSDLTRAENRFERQYGKLLQVYRGIRAPGGRRLLFETYERYSSIAASGHRLWLAFAPAIIGALVLLELVQIPLATSLVRRLRRNQEEREALLHRAVESSGIERRRIARDLHDGPVQELVGVSYSLAAAAEQLRNGSDEGQAAGAVDEAAAGARASIRQLRTLLVDLYPPNLQTEGLAAAIDDLLAPLRASGVETTSEIEAGLRLPTDTEALVYRLAQESLRNVLAHAGARHASVSVQPNGTTVGVEIADDGRGFELADLESRPGHFGLRVLADLARDAGGSFDIRSEPGAGTTVSAELPIR